MNQRSVTLWMAVTLLVCLGTFTSCSGGKNQASTQHGSGSAITAAPDSKIVQDIQMNVATVWSSDDCAPNVGLNHFKERVEQPSGGKIKVNLNKGTLGGEKDLYEALRFNTVQAAAITTGPLGGYIPLAEVLMVPYIFKDWQNAFAVVDGPFGAEIKRQGLEKNLRLLGWWSIGTRELYGNGLRPMTPDDLKGKKVRVMETPFLVALYKAYGAVPHLWRTLRCILHFSNM